MTEVLVAHNANGGIWTVGHYNAPSSLCEVYSQYQWEQEMKHGREDKGGIPSGRYAFPPNRSHRNEHNGWRWSATNHAGRWTGDNEIQTRADCQPETQKVHVGDESGGSSPCSQLPPQSHLLESKTTASL